MLPWLAASSGGGWKSCPTSVAVLVCGSRLTTMPRDWLWIAGPAPLSNTLIDPFGSSRGSCCQAVLVPAPIVKDERLPPRRHSICPVWLLTSYTVQVLRPEISRLPLRSRSSELMWKKSNGHAGLVVVGGV